MKPKKKPSFDLSGPLSMEEVEAVLSETGMFDASQAQEAQSGFKLLEESAAGDDVWRDEAAFDDFIEVLDSPDEVEENDASDALEVFLADSNELVMGSATEIAHPKKRDPRHQSLVPDEFATAAKGMSPEKIKRIESMYTLFDVAVIYLKKAFCQKDPANMARCLRWQREFYALEDLNMKQLRMQQRWIDSDCEKPICNYLNLGHLLSLLQAMLVWSCEYYGPSETSRLYDGMSRVVTSHEAANYFPAEKLLDL